MPRTEQRDALLRVLRTVAARLYFNGVVDMVENAAVEAVADALLDAGCVMTRCPACQQPLRPVPFGSDVPAAFGSYCTCRAISTEPDRPADHTVLVRLSVPGGLCVHCGTTMGQALRCEGCGHIDPPTRRGEKP